MALHDPLPLTADELAHFNAHGWVKRPALFTAGEAAEIARWTDELVALPEVPGRHMVYYEDSVTEPGVRVMQRIEDFCPYHPQFDALVRGGRLLAAVEQLLEAPAVLFKEKINFKKAGGAGFEPHQDQQAGWSAYAPMFITALVGIDRATTENGCLEMATVPRVAGMIDAESSRVTTEQPPRMKFVSVPTEPCDVLFFDSYAPHRSQANLTHPHPRTPLLPACRGEASPHGHRY